MAKICDTRLVFCIRSLLLHKLAQALVLKADSNSNKQETHYKGLKCFKTSLECSAGVVAKFYTK